MRSSLISMCMRSQTFLVLPRENYLQTTTNSHTRCLLNLQFLQFKTIKRLAHKSQHSHHASQKNTNDLKHGDLNKIIRAPNETLDSPISRNDSNHRGSEKNTISVADSNYSSTKELSKTTNVQDDQKSLQIPTPPIINPPVLPILPKKSRRSALQYISENLYKFVQNYSKTLEQRFPGAINVYRVFVVGFKDFSKELLDYLKISSRILISPSAINDLSLAELELYYRMPKEIFRVAPTLLISALPFMNYVMFPVAYYFPKTLLSSHFWSIQQKSMFAVDNQKKRLVNYRPVFRCLQANVSLVRDKILRKKCQDVLDRLGSGSHPNTRAVIEVKSLFEYYPFSIKAIYGPHVKGLLRMHGLHTFCFNRRRLYEHAENLHLMDLAMIQEGIFNMKPEDLKKACFLRGLNASNTSHEDMLKYLQQWISISTSVESESYSLLLHLPILLAYNNPNNWALLG